MITPEMIEAHHRVLHPGWYEEDACHCVQCTAERDQELDQSKAALTAALALHKPGVPKEIEELIKRLHGWPWPDCPLPREAVADMQEAAAALRSLVLEVKRLKLSLSFAQSELCKGAVIEASKQRIAELEAALAAAKAKPLTMPEGLPEGPWVAVPDYHNGWTVITDDGQGTTVAAKLREAIARAIASLPYLYVQLAKAIAMADELWIAREQIRGELDAARNKTIEECVALAETMGDALTAEELAYEIRALATGETK